MWLVHRICKRCGRKFTQEYNTSDMDMSDLCDECCLADEQATGK